MEIQTADLVVSLAGRDKDGVFYVLRTDEDFVYLADGKGRKIENPKRKKHKHVRKLPQTGTDISRRIASGDVIHNSDLRRDLAILATSESLTQGGK